jgi:tRNA (cmo5U34)-methyltransferase
MRMNLVKDHFETEAKQFDDIIVQLIPYYEQMLQALIDSIPFETESKIKVIDLGCGTGTIARKVADKFPNASIVCLDVAANMIDMAKYKLAGHSNTEFIIGDFANIDFTKKFDVVVSSLALHHLETDADKKKLYTKIFENLNPNGVFFNADVVLASNNQLQEVNMQRWKEYMNRKVSMEEIENKWIPVYENEDRPAKLIDQLAWLKEIGFESLDVLWKYYNFCVYGGVKTANHV